MERLNQLFYSSAQRGDAQLVISQREPETSESYLGWLYEKTCDLAGYFFGFFKNSPAGEDRPSPENSAVPMIPLEMMKKTPVFQEALKTLTHSIAFCELSNYFKGKDKAEFPLEALNKSGFFQKATLKSENNSVTLEATYLYSSIPYRISVVYELSDSPSNLSAIEDEGDDDLYLDPTETITPKVSKPDNAPSRVNRVFLMVASEKTLHSHEFQGNNPPNRTSLAGALDLSLVTDDQLYDLTPEDFWRVNPTQLVLRNNKNPELRELFNKKLITDNKPCGESFHQLLNNILTVGKISHNPLPQFKGSVKTEYVNRKSLYYAQKMVTKPIGLEALFNRKPSNDGDQIFREIMAVDRAVHGPYNARRGPLTIHVVRFGD